MPPSAEASPELYQAELTDDEDDRPALSSRALEALKEFLSEQQPQQRSTVAEIEGDVSLVSEDWRLSQFWYNRETAETVAAEICGLCDLKGSAVACIACPTLYPHIKKLNQDLSVQLLEYDMRFQQYGSDFTFYDYNKPVELPPVLKQAFQVVVADPPYLSQECLEKVSQTMSFLAHPQGSYLILLTGAVQKESAAELLNLYPCGFRPQHSSKLGNEFLLFTNYDPQGRLGGWERNN